MKFYWHELRDGFPVTFHLRRDWRVRWTGVFGVQVQIGQSSWFFGCVRSHEGATEQTHE